MLVILVNKLPPWVILLTNHVSVILVCVGFEQEPRAVATYENM